MMCFPKGRVIHWTPDPTNTSTPLRGSVLLYLGGNKRAFRARFKEFGLVVEV